MNSRAVHHFIVLFVAGLIAGCSTYPEKVRGTKRRLINERRRPVAYSACSASGEDKLLAWLEQGRLDQLQGRYVESSRSYRKAISFCDEQEEKAVIRIGKAVDSTQSVMMGNDKFIDYPIVGFERMMLHQLDAYNSLAIGDMDGFGVNVRHMERCRGTEVTMYKQYMAALEAKMGGKKVEAMKSSASYRNFMNDLERLAPGLSHSTDNAYGLYLIALYREAIGDLDDALKYYREIDRIWPNNSVVKQGIDHCSRKSKPKAGFGEVVVFYEEGFMPEKRTDIVRFYEDSSVLPTLYLEVPNYHEADCLPYDEGGQLFLVTASSRRIWSKTTPFCDLAPLAVKAHEERMGGIIARKTLLAGIMSAMVSAQHWHIQSSNPIAEGILLAGGLVVDGVTAFMVAANEENDLRSWLLLPRQVQMARFSVKAGGPWNIVLKAPGAEKTIPVTVKSGKKTIVYCTSVPGRLEGFSACLDKIK